MIALNLKAIALAVATLGEGDARPLADVIRPPGCIDLGMLAPTPHVASRMTAFGFDPGTLETWRRDVARCRDGAPYVIASRPRE